MHWEQSGHRSGKSLATTMGAISGAIAGKDVEIAVRDDGGRMMNLLTEHLNSTMLNYYATDNEVVIEGAGSVRVNDIARAPKAARQVEDVEYA
ncbi:MAG: hypothetical protein KI788_03960 [Mameliella sp.]|nr:hypothetical protein [Mameliella sp.]